MTREESGDRASVADATHTVRRDQVTADGGDPGRGDPATGAESVGLDGWTIAAFGDAGRVRPVVTAPAPVLSRAGAEVDPTADEVVLLAADLVATMRASPGCVGLAAPQLGVGARVFAVDVTGHPKALTVHGTFVLCNATVVEASRWRPGREGCMSVPDLTGDVKRASRLVVTGQLPGSGRDVRLVADGFEARALQHEIDHCAGLLFLDRVAGAHAVYQRKVYL